VQALGRRRGKRSGRAPHRPLALATLGPTREIEDVALAQFDLVFGLIEPQALFDRCREPFGERFADAAWKDVVDAGAAQRQVSIDMAQISGEDVLELLVRDECRLE
jgi:hypothetical protein